jgi:diguanylate cyclase (GGDEF)-like protein/PAS domain S-box-containing protein
MAFRLLDLLASRNTQNGEAAKDAEHPHAIGGQEMDEVDASSSKHARTALLTAAVLALAGSGVGFSAIQQGIVVGAEKVLVLAGGAFNLLILVALLAWRRIPVRKVAALSTAFYTLYLGGGILIALLNKGDLGHLFIYSFWCYTLLVFNKLVNVPHVGRFLARIILFAPIALICGLLPRFAGHLPTELVNLAVVFCLSYLCFGLTLDGVTKYRETYIVERERAESLRIESEVLESISDCFIALDSGFRLVYLNDAACSEFAVDRRGTLKKALSDAIPEFLSAAMLAALRAACGSASATVFEAQNINGQWYEMRCYPQLGRMSIYFRNITESVRSRQQLEAAHNRVRQQSALLDKAQDAIFVQDMESRIVYWNQGAERLFGWAAWQVNGQRATDVFQSSADDVRSALSAVVESGEWTGELAKKHKNGMDLMVESRFTLVRDEDGTPNSILAISTDITERKAADARIHNLAFHDALTGLPNRVLLRERLERMLATRPGPRSRGALLLIDLDDFKTLNDTSGHDIGDCLLQEVALRLKGCIRECDTAARLGGDEFVVMLEGLGTDAEAAFAETKLIGERIVSAFRWPYVLQHQEYEGTASIGATMILGAPETADELLKRADLAMYQAKAKGRNKLCFFDPEMESAAAFRVSLLADLKTAIHNGELELHYQPQVDSVGRVTGCEALLRWRHPVRGLVPPIEFIPLAEAEGFIVELGYWVLDTACGQLAAWAQLPAMAEIEMAVNVSIRQFLDARFVQYVERALRKSGADPRLLKLEITESFMLEAVEEMMTKMSVLKALGIGFSLDDFGTGYSSLSQLKRLPLDQLKIDQSFVRDLPASSMDASIVRTIIALARSLNLAVIAEGVETREQRDFLEEEGCLAYQGYLFSPAVPPSKFEAFVEEIRRANEESAA